MRPDVLDPPEADAPIGRDTDHRIFLAVGAGTCDSRVADGEIAAPCAGLIQGPAFGSALFVPAIVTGLRPVIS